MPMASSEPEMSASVHRMKKVLPLAMLRLPIEELMAAD